MERKQLAPGVHITTLEADKFNRCRIAIHLRFPARRDTATLDDAFIILDEAQNTTPEQMKMFLTRMGVGSKVVVTGDVTQIDLPEKTRSGLIDALEVLRHVDGIAQVRLTEKDVVRHRLVQQIVRAYEQAAEHKT